MQPCRWGPGTTPTFFSSVDFHLPPLYHREIHHRILPTCNGAKFTLLASQQRIRPIGFAYSFFVHNYIFLLFSFQSMSTYANSDVSWSWYSCDTDKKGLPCTNYTWGILPIIGRFANQIIHNSKLTGMEYSLNMKGRHIVNRLECGKRQNIAINMMIISILIDIYWMPITIGEVRWGPSPHFSLFPHQLIGNSISPIFKWMRGLLYIKFLDIFFYLPTLFPQKKCY